MHSIVCDFRVDQAMRYSLFVPRLYNLCRSLGFEAGRIMPSRAFCSDESQGFPIILITKHFGAFPFNHGRAGGVVATGRHGPHAQHGDDLVIIQASHVGYHPETGSYGSYCRLQTPEQSNTTTCGKIGHVLEWYENEYQFAQKNIYLGREGGRCTLTVDYQLQDARRAEGLFLDLDRMTVSEDGVRVLHRTLSTARVYLASEALCDLLPDTAWPEEGERVQIGVHLLPELFSFRRELGPDSEGHHLLEHNLLDAMPWVVSAPSPMLVAAQVNSQAEFDRTFRSIVKSEDYRGKNLLFISCLNIDISPKLGQMFPLTKCVPWAAYVQDRSGDSRIYEQSEIVELLLEQSSENADQIDLEAAIAQMIDAPEIRIVK